MMNNLTHKNGTFPKKVKIVEVGPRDGLQNEPHAIPTQTKIDFINRLSQTGLQTIETTSFVSAKWIPQLSDAEEVFTHITQYPGIHYPVLVPNLEGLQRALSAGVKEIAVFTAASETFSQKNTHCSIAESLDRIEAIMEIAKKEAFHLRGYISCVLGCPYEGAVPVLRVQQLAKTLTQMGCQEISLGDTIGAGTAEQARRLIETVSTDIPLPQIAVHFHDTYGQALANIYACLQLGVEVIDSSIAGLGGCPYAKGASGNVATEDVLYLLESLGIETGVDFNKLLEVTRFVANFTQRFPRSKVAQAKLGLTP